MGENKEFLVREQLVGALESSVLDLNQCNKKIHELKLFYHFKMKQLRKLKYAKVVTHEAFETDKKMLNDLYNKHNIILLNQQKEMMKIASENNVAVESQTKNVDFKALKKEYKQNLDAIKVDNQTTTEEIKENIAEVKQKYSKIKKRISTKTITIFTLISIPLILLAGLLTNYLFYYQKANEGKVFSFSDPQALGGFFVLLIILTVIFGFTWYMLYKIAGKLFLDTDEDFEKTIGIGALAQIGDTIALGSFSISIALLDVTNGVKRSEQLPGTLNIGLTVPALVFGAMTITSLEVHIPTLIYCVLAILIGSLFGSFVAIYVNRKFVPLISGVILSGVVVLLLLVQLGVFKEPLGPDDKPLKAVELVGVKLFLAILGFFSIGALQAFGVGTFAPSLALGTMVGLDNGSIIAIMSLGAGLSMPLAALTFLKTNNYSPKVSFGLMVGGVAGAVIGFFLFFVIPMAIGGVSASHVAYFMRWGSLAVTAYAAYALLYKYIKSIKVKEDVIAKKESYYQTDFDTALVNIESNMMLLTKTK